MTNGAVQGNEPNHIPQSSFGDMEKIESITKQIPAPKVSFSMEDLDNDPTVETVLSQNDKFRSTVEVDDTDTDTSEGTAAGDGENRPQGTAPKASSSAKEAFAKSLIRNIEKIKLLIGVELVYDNRHEGAIQQAQGLKAEIIELGKAGKSEPYHFELFEAIDDYIAKVADTREKLAEKLRIPDEDKAASSEAIVAYMAEKGIEPSPEMVLASTLLGPMIFDTIRVAKTTVRLNPQQLIMEAKRQAQLRDGGAQTTSKKTNGK